MPSQQHVTLHHRIRKRPFSSVLKEGLSKYSLIAVLSIFRLPVERVDQLLSETPACPCGSGPRDYCVSSRINASTERSTNQRYMYFGFKYLFHGTHLLLC